MESFWSALKLEAACRTRFATRDQTRAEIFDCIEIFCSSRRAHTALGCLSPVDFESQNY